MADKRISQLVERTDIANNDVVPIVAFGASTTNKATISSIQSYMQENLDVGVTSIGLSMPSAFVVSNSPVTMSGNISVTGAGTVSQYIRGDGSLADFPQGGGGGGASVNYYLNGSVSQGTIGGIAYREMNRTPILGTGTDFVAIADGYLASFITDAGDPALLEIPGGNWNFETYFSASSGGGTPSFYVELYKIDSGGTATLIASNSATPELIAFGTTITPYFSTLAVPTTTLTLTDRLALRYYVARSGRTITLHTENSHLCQIITTFTTGLTALNGLTAQVQNFTTGTSGTNFAISSTGNTHTFNLPDASATARGVVTTGIQTIAGIKNFTSTIRSAVSVEMAATGTALPTELKNINGPGLSSSGSNGIGFNSSNNLYFAGSEKGCAVISMTNTGTRTYTLQDTSGVIALTSNIPTNPLGGSGTINQIPKYTSSTTTLGNSNISDNGTDVGIASRTAISLGGQSIIFTPNLGGTTNRIETTGSLPLALITGGALTFAAGGATPQITLATTGAVTLTGALNGTSAVFSGNAQVSKLLLGTSTANSYRINLVANSDFDTAGILLTDTNTGGRSYAIGSSITTIGSLEFRDNTAGQNRLTISSTGAATFSSSVTANGTFFGKGNVVYQNGSTNVLNVGTDELMYGGTNSDGGVFVYGNNKLHLSTNSQRRLTIDGTGSVGIGTNSPLQRLHVSDSAGVTRILVENTANAAAGAGVFMRTFNGATQVSNATLRVDKAGNFQIYSGAASDSLMINCSSNGRVGIGTDTPASKFEVVDGTGSVFRAIGNGTNVMEIGNYKTTGSGGAGYQQLDIAGSILAFYTGTAGGGSAPERMRITSGGAVLVNQTTASAAATGSKCMQVAADILATGGLAGYFFENRSGGVTANSNWYGWYATAGTIFLYNGAANAASINPTTGVYTPLSDLNKKKDFENSTIGLNEVLNLKPTLYRMATDESEGEKELGFIAQEVKEFIPQAYVESGEEDAKFIGLNYNAIVAALVKSVQELKTEIDSLKNQIK